MQNSYKTKLCGIKNHLAKETNEIWEILSHNPIILLVIVLAILLGFFLYKIDTPPKFVPGTIVKIEEGTSIKEASLKLQNENIIKSPTFFNFYVQLSDEKAIIAGEYLFSAEENAFKVANRITNGVYGIPIKEITFPEGITVMQIADILDKNLPNFEKESFINLALKYEGYLFPDTYKFSLIADEMTIIEKMRDNFNNKILEIKEQIKDSEKTLDEIITMASIVEREATPDTIQKVSDVLWHRLSDGMLLQVDATFVYSIDKNSFTVTRQEMRDESDPYNTYVHYGLPPTPISNPGMESILASLNSNETDLVFFLTGRDGEMYFAKTFDEHKMNRRLHLD